MSPAKTACVTVGCFDVLHRGHTRLFEAIKARAEHVVVGIHDDDSIFKNKNTHVADTLSRRVAKVTQVTHVDETFVIRQADPSHELRRVVGELRSRGYTVVYMRGDDWRDFPGAQMLCAMQVPVFYHPYTVGVSSTMLRESMAEALRRHDGGSVTETCMSTLESYHYRYIYRFMDRLLTHALTRWCKLPSWVTPNHVTLTSLSLVAPAMYTWQKYPVLYVMCVVLHDTLDRMDGCLARLKAGERDTRFGAYLDAMCDKLFSFMIHLCFIRARSLHGGAFFSLISFMSLAKMILHVISAGVRTRLFLRARADGHDAIKSNGTGKLATFLDNVSVALYVFHPAVSLALQALSSCFTLRSVMQKL